jgi:NAD(P)-dependent dehydrogenase (short-subunit alcohol dehydrogenase family)
MQQLIILIRVGIGLAFVKLCHSKNAKVLIGDLKLTEEAQAFVKANGDATVAFVECDVTNWASLKNLITESVKVFGSVPDVYVPCAGVFEPPWSNFWDDSEDDAGSYKMMRINVEHPIKLTRIAIKALLGADKKGVVCLVSSGAGLQAFYTATLYSTSKHAVIGLAKNLGAADEEEGVKVVCICPGIVTSPLWTDRGNDHWKKFFEEDAGKLGAIATPDEIAEGMLKLVEEGKYVGGTVMLKTKEMEMIVHEGSSPLNVERGQEVGDIGHVRGILNKERGAGWQG